MREGYSASRGGEEMDISETPKKATEIQLKSILIEAGGLLVVPEAYF